MEYFVSFASWSDMPHLIMIVGAVLVFFGVIGILVRRSTRGPTDDAEVAHDAEEAPFGALREEPPQVLAVPIAPAESGRQAARQPRR
jgi:hypothetical protein